MSETESTQLWNDEDDDLPGGPAFADALSSLEEHLHEHQGTENLPEDEEQVYAELYEEGVEFEPDLNANGEPEEVSFTDFTEEDAYPNHGSQPEEDAGLASLDDELDAAFVESGVSLDDELDAAFAEPEVSLDDELDAAFVEPELSLDDELDAAYVAPVADSEDSVADETYTEVEDEDFLAAEETASDELEESFEAYPAYEDSHDEVSETYGQEVSDEVPAAASSSADSPMAAMIGGQDTDDFNLATLTQLVDEIRQESERVSEMKDSVARALNLIQEMSESLKS